MEAGISYARVAARSGHPPRTITQGRATADQPLGYLLAKTAETVWEAASATHTDSESQFVAVRNYIGTLAEKTGLSEARDFALVFLPSAFVRRRTAGLITQVTREARGRSRNRRPALVPP